MQELVFGTYPSWSHLVVRLMLGAIFFAHGAQKVFGWFGGPGLTKTIAGFRQMNIPAAATVTAACIECFGGLAMLVAIKKVHARHGFFLNWSLAQDKGHGFEFNLALIAMALSIVIGGAGVLSIDWLIAPLGGVDGGAAR